LEKVPDVGSVWAALAQARPETGLVPFLLSGLHHDTERPWDLGEFEDPADITKLDDMDAAAILEELWDGQVYEVGDEDEPLKGEDEDEEFAEYISGAIAPFSREFPGLAPPLDERLTAEERQKILRSQRAARIGLAAASRPADVLPLIGWDGAANRWKDSLAIAAVLRSWEDRFGSTLLDVGFAEFRLLAERPPRTLEVAQRIAAEHFAFCDEFGGNGLNEVPDIASHLLKTPIWTFWWD
jgi:hypothetical protein